MNFLERRESQGEYGQGRRRKPENKPRDQVDGEVVEAGIRHNFRVQLEL